jgi:hypothetical protein
VHFPAIYRILRPPSSLVNGRGKLLPASSSLDVLTNDLLFQFIANLTFHTEPPIGFAKSTQRMNFQSERPQALFRSSSELP